MTKKKTDKPSAPSNPMPDKLLINYLNEAMEIFDLRMLPWSDICEDCGEEVHTHTPRTEEEDMFRPRFHLFNWEELMEYDLPEREHIEKLLRIALTEKLEEFITYATNDIEFFFKLDKEDYPKYKQEKIEKETAKAQLKSSITKEQQDLIYAAYPTVKHMDEHEDKHRAIVEARQKETEKAATNKELN